MIRLQDVTKVYKGGTVAVKDIVLDIPKGEFVFLVGASGSGKSTLIRMMLREEDAREARSGSRAKTSLRCRHGKSRICGGP